MSGTRTPVSAGAATSSAVIRIVAIVPAATPAISFCRFSSATSCMVVESSKRRALVRQLCPLLLVGTLQRRRRLRAFERGAQLLAFDHFLLAQPRRQRQ